MKTETNRLEYKRELTDDIEKEIVAFLNSEGGRIYIGIEKDGSVVGVSQPDALQLQIKDKLINNIRPNIMGLFDIFVEDHDGKKVVIINLASGPIMPYYIRKYGRSEKGCFMRVGSSSQPMTEEYINELMHKRHPISLTQTPSRHQDLTFNQLKIFYEGKGTPLNSNFAKTLDFLTPDGKYNLLAYLFADTNNFSIRVAKWWGTDKTDLRENEEYGNSSLTKAMQKVLDKFEIENVTQARKVGLGPRQEKRLVDNESLREAIINAFAHNDYSSGDTPVFEIYSDRFEITTYGGLVSGLTREEFFAGVSRPRSPEIMRILKDLDFVERLGSGIPYIVGKYGREIFQFMDSVIRFSFPFDRSIEQEEGKKVNTREETREKTREETREKIIQAVKDKPSITAKELAELMNLTPKGIEWNLKKLKEENIIRRIGPKKGGHWEIINK